jgi:hypothetical protein
MDILYDFDLVENLNDDSHCFQACIAMILKKYLPNEDTSFGTLDRLTAKHPTGGTWAIAGLLYLQSLGFDISIISTGDYEKFVLGGIDYLRETFGDAFADAELINSDVAAEQERAKILLEKVNIELRTPNFDDIELLLQDSFAIVVIDTAIINNLAEYSGHFVLITGIDDSGVIINDPGLPAEKNRHISFDNFYKAWCTGGEVPNSLYIIKKITDNKLKKL